MALVTNVNYESPLKRFEDISSLTILNMLKDVRVDIGRLDQNFANADLLQVLKAVESGKYEINGSVSTRVNLSSAKGNIEAYRRYSEGGCQSCVSLGSETIDAQDASKGFYCEVDDPDFNKNEARYTIGCRSSGFSPKVQKHYKTPCESHKPRFSPKLEEVIAKEI